MSDLPRGWASATVGELAQLIDYGSSAKTAAAGDVPVLRMGNINGGRLVFDELKYLPANHAEFPDLFLASGDLLFNRTNSIEHVGKTAVYEGLPRPCSFASYLLRVRLRGDYDPRLLAYYINSPYGRRWVESVVSQQVGQANVNGAKLRALEVPVPPGPEQHRIVAQIANTTARSRRAREALDAIPVLLDRFRQSVLAAAFRGDLTADWRDKNPEVEPAEELLKRIRIERRRTWEEAQLAKMRAKGKVPGDDRWKERYEEPALADTNELPELPEGWCWASLEEVCALEAPIVYGIIQPGDDVPDGVPYVRPLDMTDDGGIDFESIKRTSPEIEAQYERARLKAGDVILSIVGTIGKVVITPGALDGANITQSSVRIRPPAGMLSEYMRFALLSPQLRKQYDQYRFGIAVQRLNVEHARRLVMPLAPGEEQRLLTSRLIRLLQRVPHKMIQDMRGQLAGFDRAILAKAFRGELVPQDPTDEPASALLERLRAPTAPPQEQVSLFAAGTEPTQNQKPRAGRRARSR